MPESAGDRQWLTRTNHLKNVAQLAAEHADLLERVDVRWRRAIQVQNGSIEVRILPVGDSLYDGSWLCIRRTKSGWSFTLTRDKRGEPDESVRRRATPATGPRVLNDMLGCLLAGRRLDGGRTNDWGRIVRIFRQYGALEEARASLLDGVDLQWHERFGVFDNGREFGLLHNGDTPRDGRSLWMTRTPTGWNLRLVERSRHSEQVVEDLDVRLDEAAERLNELLSQMVQDTPPLEGTAQDAYRVLIRDHVGPALRSLGYKGSGGRYRREAGDYQISITFQRSRWSVKERVEYRLNISVQHPETTAAYDEANDLARAMGRQYERAPAGSWGGSLPGRLGPADMHWFALRRGDDLPSHGRMLLEAFQTFAVPAIEEQLHLPLSLPTPPDERDQLSPDELELRSRRQLAILEEAFRRRPPEPPTTNAAT